MGEMHLFVTAGRGTEDFVELELQEKLNAKRIKKTDGKIFFQTDLDTSDVASSINHLKCVERIFVCVLHKNDLRITSAWKGKQQLETAFKNISRTEWMDCYSTYRHCTRLQHCVTECCAAEQQTEGHRYKIVNNVSEHQMASDPDAKETAAVCEMRRTEKTNSQQLTNVNSMNKGCKRRKVDVCDTITFRISCKVSGLPGRFFKAQNLGISLGILLKHHMQWKADLRNPNVEVFVHVNNQGLMIGIPLTRKPLSEREYFQHIGLRTPIAYIMAQLACIQAGDVVLDPMCGAGTILIEAAKSWPSAHYIGSDRDVQQLTKSTENIQKSREMARIELMYCDALYLPLTDKSVDVVVSDLPFGHIHGQEKDMYALYPKLVHLFNRVLKTGGHCVLLTSEKLRDFLLHTVCSDTVLNHSGHEDKDLLNMQTSAKIRELQQQPTEDVLPKESRDILCLELSWIVKCIHYVKLGDTHAFICSFVKS